MSTNYLRFVFYQWYGFVILSRRAGTYAPTDFAFVTFAFAVMSSNIRLQFSHILPLPTPVQCWQNTLSGVHFAICHFPTLKGEKGGLTTFYEACRIIIWCGTPQSFIEIDVSMANMFQQKHLKKKKNSTFIGLRRPLKNLVWIGLRRLNQ